MNSCMSVWASQMQSATHSQAHPRMIQHLSNICTVMLNTSAVGLSPAGANAPKALKGLYDREIKATVTVILPSSTAGFRWMLYSRHFTLPSSPAHAL